MSSTSYISHLATAVGAASDHGSQLPVSALIDKGYSAAKVVPSSTNFCHRHCKFKYFMYFLAPLSNLSIS